MFPGASTNNQIDRILEVTGRPSKEDIAAMKSEFAAQMLEKLPDPQAPRSLETLFPHADADAVDLLQKLLCFNPEKRLSAAESLDHSYVSQFHVPEEEITCDKPITIPIDDNKKLTVTDYREELYTNIIKVNVETKKASRETKKKIKSARGNRDSREGKKARSKPKRSNSGGSTTKKKRSNE